MYNADVKADRVRGALFPEEKRICQFIKTNISFVCLPCETRFFSFDFENILKRLWFQKLRFEKGQQQHHLQQAFFDSRFLNF